MANLRVYLCSDIHIDTWDFDWELVAHWGKFDVVCLVGDVSNDISLTKFFLDRVAKTYPQVQILFVAGNHDFYNTDLISVDLMLAKIDDENANFHYLRVLDDSTCTSYTVGNVVFIGDTLWTDFRLNTLGFGDTVHENSEYYMNRAHSRMNDYHCILTQPLDISNATGMYMSLLKDKKEAGLANQLQCMEVNRYLAGLKTKLTPMVTAALHKQQLDVLLARAEDAKSLGYTVVMLSHHLPDKLSCDTRYHYMDIDPAYASNLLESKANNMSYWFHGHSHKSNDYTKNGVRVICNPNGYNEPNQEFMNFELEIPYVP